MKKIILLLFVLGLLCGFAQVGLADEYNKARELYVVCIEPDDKTGLTIERALCDEEAELRGRSHGIFIPSNNKTVECPDEGMELYVCKGVGEDTVVHTPPDSY